MSGDNGSGPWVFTCTYPNGASIVRGPTDSWDLVQSWLEIFSSSGETAIYSETSRREQQAPSHSTQVG